MAALSVQRPTSTGTTPSAPAQISAWASADTISGSEVGERGLIAIVANGSGGSLDFRVSDPGTTPAGNAPANGYTTITVPNAAARDVFIGKNNVNPATGQVTVGASTTNAAFTVRLVQH